jgi:ATP-dependent RNA circularization protein (DNA/RNA ligase family)
MHTFFRFPSTHHLAWLSKASAPRDDKILSQFDVKSFLSQEIVVEEKVDGANIGISLAEDGTLQVQNRGQFLAKPYSGQFLRLSEWLSLHAERIQACIDAQLILFGEWCAAKHTVGYSNLPDWFLLFDVYDRKQGQFWSSIRRNSLASAAGLATVPTLQRGRTNLNELTQLLSIGSSRYGTEPIEGLIVRCEDTQWCKRRAKLVRADFTQAIDEHWTRRSITWNRVDWSLNEL